MPKGVFITGTDTGVGKTIVSAVLIRAFQRRGKKLGVMKPVETGCVDDKGSLIPADATFLKKISRADDPLDTVTPVRLPLPLAPMVAAELEGTEVDLNAILEAFRTLLTKYEFLVVEGVGGLLVPLTSAGTRWPAYFVSNLIRDMGLPVLIVARSTLGTINHTLLTIHHALREGLTVAGVIINHHEPPANTLAEKTNPEILKRLCPVPVIAEVPHIDPITMESIEKAGRGIDINAITRV